METSYITTDLDLDSDHDLSLLAKCADEKEMLVHYCGPANKGFRLVFGLAINDSDPDEAISVYTRFVESLESEALELWFSCRSRSFNIGYEAGSKESSYRSTVSAQSLAQVTKYNGSVMVTIYKRDEVPDKS